MIKYIEERLEEGFSKDKIKQVLHESEWPEHKIEEAFEELEEEVFEFGRKHWVISLIALLSLGAAFLIINGVSSGGNLQDCGNDLTCFIQAAENCEKASYEETVKANMVVVNQSVSRELEIRGTDGAKCLLHVKVKDVELNFSKDTAKIEKEHSRSLMKDQEGESGTCRLSVDYLTSMLEKWKYGQRSVGDLNRERCSGSLFNNSAPAGS